MRIASQKIPALDGLHDEFAAAKGEGQDTPRTEIVS
jgi:hypothetical protein